MTQQRLGTVSLATMHAFEEMMDKLLRMEEEAAYLHHTVWARIYKDLQLEPDAHYTYNRTTGEVTLGMTQATPPDFDPSCN